MKNTKGRQIRFRVKRIEEGENKIHHSLRPKKTRQSSKAINELYYTTGRSTTDQNEIMEIEVNHYKKE